METKENYFHNILFCNFSSPFVPNKSLLFPHSIPFLSLSRPLSLYFSLYMFLSVCLSFSLREGGGANPRLQTDIFIYLSYLSNKGARGARF